MNNIIKNKVFCMLPWIHVYVESDGSTRPCCVGSYGVPYGSVRNQTMKQILNNDVAKNLRKNMLEGKSSEICTQCYLAEEVNENMSLRNFANNRFGHHLDEVLEQTEADGTLRNVKLRYIDIRLSNICNFKCRSCSHLFSSSIAAEEKKYDKGKIVFQKPRDDSGIKDEIFEEIHNIEQIYFAGGEPLITDDHYLILEELIRQEKSNITLRYNSNCSTLYYKDKNLLDLWKNFKKIEFQASIDHVQERAEYIRHGTDWAVVENNLSLLVNLPNLNFSVNTVLSIFNYLTLDKFYTYMIDRGLIRKYHHVSLYRLTTPHFLCVQNLPRSLKDLGRQTNSNLSAELQGNQYEFYNIVQDAIAFTELLHPNEIFPTHYKKEIQQKDKLRNENIETTFPELRELKIYD